MATILLVLILFGAGTIALSQHLMLCCRLRYWLHDRGLSTLRVEVRFNDGLPACWQVCWSNHSQTRRCYSSVVDVSRRTHKHFLIPGIVAGTVESNSNLLEFRCGEWTHRSSSWLLRRTPRCYRFRKASLQWCNPGTDSSILLLHNSLGLWLGHLGAFPRLPNVQWISTSDLLLHFMVSLTSEVQKGCGVASCERRGRYQSGMLW